MVSITTESVNRGVFFDFTTDEAGSGFVVRPNGYIVTNSHVVETARQIKVHLPDGDTYNARLVGRDEVSDLAVLKISADGLPTATLGNSTKLRVGDWVMTMGNALALKGGPTVTLGIVSGLDRTLRAEEDTFYGLIQTDAAINTGNSGGPLVNLDGEVVGINQATLLRAQGVGFAISSSIAAPIIDSLIEHGRVIRPYMGFSGADVTPAIANEFNLNVGEGVIVTFISRTSPAYEAGIRVGDVVVKMDGIPTSDVSRWLNLLWSYQVGDEVVVEYMRNNEPLTVTIELAERDA